MDRDDGIDRLVDQEIADGRAGRVTQLFLFFSSKKYASPRFSALFVVTKNACAFHQKTNISPHIIALCL